MNPASNVQCTIQFYFILRKNCDLFINFLLLIYVAYFTLHCLIKDERQPVQHFYFPVLDKCPSHHTNITVS